ncbi:MAG: thioredoxin, partial [Candidatus Obscuribacterales bacterium]|nr:thioredoxin [Steroidobacteraceae bacterium]
TDGNFNADVLQAAQPVLVDFWAEWCGPCKQLMPVLDKLAAEYAGRFSLVKVNADEEQALAAQIGIRSLPTVVLFKNGAVVDHFMGVVPEAQIRQLLDRHLPAALLNPLDQARALKQASDYAGAQLIVTDALAKDPSDLTLQCEAGELEALTGDLDTARKTLETAQGRDPEAACVKRLTAVLTFSDVLAAHPDSGALRARLAIDPNDLEARHALAVHRLLAADYDAALEDWLDIMRCNRKFQDDLARKSLVLAFELIGNADPRVAQTRREMARMLF